MQKLQQQEQQLLNAFRQMIAEDKNRLVRLAVASAEQSPAPKPHPILHLVVIGDGLRTG